MDKYIENGKNINYNLFGIINHSGNIFEDIIIVL